RERELRINRRRKVEGSPDSRGRKNCDRQIDESSLLGEKIEESISHLLLQHHDLRAVLQTVGAVRHDCLATHETGSDFCNTVRPSADGYCTRMRNACAIDNEYLEAIAIGNQRLERCSHCIFSRRQSDLAINGFRETKWTRGG